jgi:hypothetical protein
MAISCSDGKTTLVKWSDIQDLAYQLVTARVSLNLESKVPYLRDTYPLFKQLTFEQTNIRLWWEWVPGTTDFCNQVYDWWFTQWTPTEAQQWALDRGRLFFTAAAPETGLDEHTTAPCFCCLNGQVRVSDGYYYLFNSPKATSCGTSLDFASPCLKQTGSGSSLVRSGMLNTAYLATKSFLAIDRNVYDEVGGQYVLSSRVCDGSSEYVNYHYVWSESRGGYELRQVSMYLSGFFTWDIRASDFQALWDHLNALRSASCGAKPGQFAFAGTTTAIPQYCPVRESDFVWSLKKITPNTAAGCLEYNGSNTKLPWVVSTGGAPTSSCGGLMVYCNTMKHLEAHIQRLDQLEAKPADSECFSYDKPEVWGSQAEFSDVAWYFLGLRNGVFVTGLSSIYTYLKTESGYTWEPPGSFSYSEYDGIVSSHECSINVSTGNITGLFSSSDFYSYAANSRDVGGASFCNDSNVGHNGGNVSTCPYFFSSGPTTVTGNQTYLSSYGSCSKRTGNFSETARTSVTDTNSFTIDDYLQSVLNHTPVYPDMVKLADGGVISSVDSGVPLDWSIDATSATGGSMSPSISRGRYKFVFPPGVPAGYKFTWNVWVSIEGAPGVLIERSYTATANQVETEVFYLPHYSTWYTAIGPSDVVAEGCEAPPAPPTQVLTPAKVKAVKNKPLRHAVGADNSPTSFSSSGTPPGLSFDTTSGEFTGSPTTPGTYEVTIVATNEHGTTTDTFEIEVLADPLEAAPAITKDPQSVSVVEGGTAVLSVAAYGPALNFQWYQNSIPIGGANASSLVLSTVTSGAADSYTVVVSNSNGSVTSAAATLTVLAQVAVVSQPQASVTIVGNNATFSVTSAGSSPLSYQWYKDGNAIAGANSASYTITNVQVSHEGSYYVEITNSISSIFSTSVLLSAQILPVITTHPESGTHVAGNTLTLTVAATGRPTPSYQWYKNGGALSNDGRISGATSSTLTIANLVLTDEAVYTAVATNAAGSAGSNQAVVVIHQIPFITTQPQDLTVVGGEENNAGFSVTAGGTPGVTYQWKKGGTNIPNGGRVSGATTSTLLIGNIVAGDEDDYSVQVTNSAGNVVSEAARLTVWLRPTITQHPIDEFVAVGFSATFTAAATGTPLPTYQWQKDGFDIPGETAVVLNFGEVTAADAGAYRMAATNAVGTTYSNVSRLTVGAVPAFATPTAPTTFYANPGDTVQLECTLATSPAPDPYPSFQWYKDGNPLAGQNALMLSIPGVQESTAGAYYLVAINIFGSAQSELFTVDVTDLPTIITQPADQTLNPGEVLVLNVLASGPIVPPNSTPELTYRWKKDGVVISSPEWRTDSAYLSGAGVTEADEGTYTVNVRNSAGAVTSREALVSVRNPPTITTHPVSQTVVQGATINLFVVATGTAPLTYQWTKNGVNITDATDSTYSIVDSTTNDSAIYRVTVINSAGSAVSNAAVIVVNYAPSITNQPGNRTVVGGLGLDTSFTVEAIGLPAVAFQWKKNGVELTNDSKFSGATSPTLIVTNVVLADDGGYSCVVSNDVSSVESITATLTVWTVPTFITHPVSQFVVSGSTVTFAVQVSGIPTPTYQWYKGESSIYGQTSDTLELVSVGHEAAGEYRCAATSSAGETFSNVATLTIGAVPGVTTTSPTTVNANPGDTVQLTCSVTGDPTPALQWYKDNVAISGAQSTMLQINNVLEVDQGNYYLLAENEFGQDESPVFTLDVTNLPTIFVQPQSATVNPGATVALDVSASGPAAGGSLQYRWSKGGTSITGWLNYSGLTLLSVQESDEGSYSVEVKNSAGTVVSNAALITVLNPPVISGQPQSQSVLSGSPVEFSVVATGEAPLTYQWKKGGVSIQGATGSTYSIASAEVGDAGTYTVTVTNVVTSVTSNDAELTVNTGVVILTQPTQPNIPIPQGSNVTLSVSAYAVPEPTYKWYKDGNELYGENSSSLALNPLQYAAAGTYFCTITNSVNSATTNDVEITVGSLPVFTDPTGDITINQLPGASQTLSVTVTGDPAPTLQWYGPGGLLASETGSSFTIPNLVDTRDSGDYYVEASNTHGTVISPTITLDITDKPAITSQPQGGTFTSGAYITLSVSASSPVGYSLTYQWYGPDGLIAGAISASYSFTATVFDDGAYWVEVTNAAGTTTSNSATIVVQGAPVIVTQPVGATITGGGSHTLDVYAFGPGPLNYQWYLNNYPILGATSASYSITGATISDQGDYRCEISNSFGGVATNTVTVTVQAAPTITTQPEGATVNPGTTVSFSVEASGSPLLQYQWKKNGNDIIGAAGNTYTIGNAVVNDAGSYTCQVSNSYGNTTSSAAILFVNSPPVVTVDPQGGLFSPGSNVTLTAQASGTGPMSYEWKISGFTVSSGSGSSATLSLNNIQLANAGVYSCVFTNMVGSETSAGATVNVGEIPQITSAPSSVNRNPGEPLSWSVSATGSPVPDFYWYKQDVEGVFQFLGVIASTFDIAAVDESQQGTYKVQAINIWGSVYSSEFSLDVTDRPSISSQPTAVETTTGSNVSFSVTASGPGTLTYQWYLGPVALTTPSATTNTLSIGPVTLSDEGNYYCDVTNAAGTTSSDSAYLTVDRPPTIQVQPVGADINQGGSLTMWVEAAGVGVLSYQWYRDGVAIPFATASSYTIYGAQPGIDDGDYYCEVSNYVAATGFSGSTGSTSATVNVNYAPVITQHPGDDSSVEGSNMTFLVMVDAYPAPSYQWYFNGIALTNAGKYSGVDTSVLTITEISTSEAGSYYVSVGNTQGTVNSSSATLTVTLAAPEITDDPVGGDVAPGSNHSLSVTATGTSLVYQWQVDGVDIPNTNSSQLTIFNFSLSDVGSYTCVVSNSGGTATSAAAQLYYADQPIISDQPQNVVMGYSQLGMGINAAFSVAVDSATPGPFTFAWYRNGANMYVNTQTLTLYSVNASDSGEFTCVVSNTYGSVETSSAYLIVPPQTMYGATEFTGTVGVPLSIPLAAVPMYPGEELTYACTWYGSVPGVDFDATSEIYGTPESYVGTPVQVQVAVTNAAGTTYFPYYISVDDQTPVITSTNADTGSVGVEYSYLVTADYNPIGFDCSIPSGLIGFSFNAYTHVLYGTPLAAGTYYIDFSAYNNAPSAGTLTLTLTIT